MAQITLNSTGIASSGALVLQSNGTTTAVTVSTGQVATLVNDAVVNGLTVGRGAGAVATNTAVGASALAANQAGGTNNTAIGNAALDANTTGDANTAVGDDALGANTTASNNTAVGYQAGYSTTTGDESVYIGQAAGYSATVNGQNTFVGRFAGNPTTGQLNAFFGYGAGSAVTTGTKNTIIGRYDGNFGGLDIRTASNYIVLSDGDGNPAAYRNSANTWSFGDASNQCAVGIQDNRSNVGTLTTTNTNASYTDYLITATASRAATTSYGFFRGIANSVAQYYIYGNGTTAAPSDERLKKNVETARDGYLDDIAKLRVVKYNWKTQEEGEAKELGFIAQEFEQVFPRLVDELAVPVSEETPNPVAYKSIKNSVIVPMLVKAIQELKAEFDAYKATHP